MKKILGFTGLVIILGLSPVYAWELPHIWNPPGFSGFDGGSTTFDDWHSAPMWGASESSDLGYTGDFSGFSDPLNLWELRGSTDLPHAYDDPGPIELPHIWD